MRRVVALAIALAACRPDRSDATAVVECVASGEALSITDFHGDRRKLGWFAQQTALTPASVGDGSFGEVWSSPVLDAETIDGVTYEPHVYATPLYVDDVEVAADEFAGRASLVFVATSNGWVYAIAADEDCEIAPGTIVWRRRLAPPMAVARLDGGVPLGVLGTPVIDLDASRIYVGAIDADLGWTMHALGLADGEPSEGWPVVLDPASVEALNPNGPARMWSAEIMSQRGGLVLSPTGDRVYATFGTFQGEGVGWIVAVDTGEPKLAASFSSAPWSGNSSAGGMWGSSGPTVAADGNVWVTTGNGPPEAVDAPRSWSSSLLELDRDLLLRRVYTPANYCVLDAANMDLGASQPLLLPEQAGAFTPNLLAFGGKQGTVYLVDRDAVARAGEGRAACDPEMVGDASLHPPGDQPQYGGPGPLSVFGPYSEEFGQIDHAKMRTKIAYFTDDAGTWLFASGATKESEESTTSVPPSIAKLRVVLPADAPAYLEISALEPTITFFNPGPPVLGGTGADAIVWVLDANARRVDSLLDPATSGPVLHAFAAADLRPLWHSDPLPRAGKYAAPTLAHGRVLVGTDRIHAFGPMAP